MDGFGWKWKFLYFYRVIIARDNKYISLRKYAEIELIMLNKPFTTIKLKIAKWK